MMNGSKGRAVDPGTIGDGKVGNEEEPGVGSPVRAWRLHGVSARFGEFE